jgi:hypothetical protein
MNIIGRERFLLFLVVARLPSLRGLRMIMLGDWLKRGDICTWIHIFYLRVVGSHERNRHITRVNHYRLLGLVSSRMDMWGN